MYLVVYLSLFITYTASAPSASEYPLPQHYTFYYETYQYAINTAHHENTTNNTQLANHISSHLSIGNLSIYILKSASRPHLIQITPATSTPLNQEESISIEYDDDEAFNTIEIWSTPHRHRRRLRTCGRWKYIHGHWRWQHYYCHPIAPPDHNPFWNPRYYRRGRFLAYYPGKHGMSWDYCASHCAYHAGGLASIHSHHENHQAMMACRHLVEFPKAHPQSEYAGWWRQEECWIGLRRPFHQWVDRSPVRFSRWHPGEPNNWGHHWGHREDCTEMWGWKGDPGGWNDVSCHARKLCLCQMPRGIIRGNYIGVQTLKHYHGASEYCAEHYGTELATITTLEDQRIAHELCLKLCLKNWDWWCQCWIGLRKPWHEWDDGSNADQKFTNWIPGLPSHYGGCVTMLSKPESYRGKWHDIACGAHRYILCNAQSRVERMGFADREEMIAKRVARHKVRWQEFQMEAYRRKVRKTFFEQLKKQRALIRKHRREKQQKMRDYYRQMAFQNVMRNVRGRLPYGGRSGAGALGAFGGKSVFYGDHYAKQRRLQTWIEGNNDGMKRMSELQLQNNRKQRTRKHETRMLQQRERNTDDDDVFYSDEYSDEMWIENTNPEPKRCVFLRYDDSLYELCLNDDYVELTRYIEKKQQIAPPSAYYMNVIEMMNVDAVERFRYKQLEAMDATNRTNSNEGLVIRKMDHVQFLKVSEFIFDHEIAHKKQCYSDPDHHKKYKICLEFQEMENEMLVDVNSNSKWISFEKDQTWNEVYRVYYNNGNNIEKIKKCATSYLQYKVCVTRALQLKQLQNADEYRVIVMKAMEHDHESENMKTHPQMYPNAPIPHHK